MPPMELSILIARIFGVIYTVIGLGILINGDHYRKVVDNFLKNPALTYLGGLIALLAGFLLVTYHNIWDGSWRVIISVIGWMALVKGVLLLICPGILMNLSKGLFKGKKATLIGGFIALVIGLVLGYFGFCCKGSGG